MNTPHEVLQAASQLPEAARVHIIEALLDTLGPETAEDPAEVDRAWRDETRRRCDELKTGKVSPVPWEQVQADAERLFDGGD